MGRICVIRQHYYPLDPRLLREVDALVQAGYTVDLICLPHGDQPRFERRGRLTIRRLPLAHRRRGTLRYLYEYTAFLIMAAVVAGALHLRHRYDLVQVNSIPDSLVFAAIVPRLLGTPVLLDLCECMPEFYATRFGTSLSHPAIRGIARVEQASIRFARRAITCTEQMRQAFVARGAEPDRIAVVMNAADEDTFDPTRFPSSPRRPGQFVLICHGSVEERYGLDTAVRAVALLRDQIPELRLEVFGDGSYLSELRRLASRLAVEDRVFFSGGFVPIQDLVRAIAAADAGIVAMKRDAFRDLTLCNKMFDFIAMGRPAIVSRTRSVEDYFDDSCFQMFTSGDQHDLARAIGELYRDPALGERLAQQASRVNERYRWPRQRELYLRIVAGLIHGEVEALPAGSALGSPGR